MIVLIMSCSKPLTTQQMVGMGCKVTGQTGEAKLLTLKALKLLDITKQGVIIKT